jgi:hypothetical protein
VATDDQRIVLLVNEAGDGPTDWSGDGDVQDTVLFVHRVGANTTSNSAIPASAVAEFRGDWIPYLTQEFFGAQDLNGDGDLVDTVAFYLNTGSGPLGKVNTGLAVNRLPVAAGDALWQLVFEGIQGVDLNGNGSATEYVHFVTHFPTATVRNCSTVPFVSPLQVTRGLTPPSLFTPQGAVGSSGSLAHFDAATGTLTTFAPTGFPLLRSGDRVLLKSFEGVEGSDLNGDGDLADAVLRVHDLGTGSTVELGVAAEHASSLDPPFCLAYVDEAEQGATDLNGDGDALDLVAHRVDLRRQRVANTGLAVARGTFPDTDMLEPGHATRRLTFVVVSEADQGATDLNGDGDALDQVLQVLR